MKVNIPNEDVVMMFNGLKEMGYLPGKKFAHARNRTMSKIRPILYKIDEVYKPPNDYLTYDEQRAKLCEKFSKNKDGIIKRLDNGDFDIQDKEGFNKEVKILQKKCEKIIKARDQQLKYYEKMLKESIEIEIHTIAEEEISDDIIGHHYDAILPMIRFTNSNIKLIKKGKKG